MKIVLAADAPHLQAQVFGKFGHAPYYIILDPADMENFSVYQGKSEELSAHGMELFSKSQVEAVVAGNFGTHAFADIIKYNAKPYLIRKKSIREAVELVSSGQVEPLNEPTVKKDSHHSHNH